MKKSRISPHMGWVAPLLIVGLRLRKVVLKIMVGQTFPRLEVTRVAR